MFVELQKVTISFVVSVHQFICLSTLNNSDPEYFQNLVRKLKFH